MMNPQEEYNRLHDHCQALGRERDALQELLHEIADNLGNALYSDEWRTREYGIAVFSRYTRLYPEHEIDVDLRLDR
jgi:hypothetical protein